MWVILRPLGKNAWSGLTRYRNCFDVLRPYLTRSGRIYTGLTEKDAARLGKTLGLDLFPGSEFWTDWSGIRVGSKEVYLNIDDPMDELRYLFLKNHKRVAGSIFERKATADYVLINKEEEAKKANIYNKAKRRAAREFDKLSAEDVRRCMRLYGQNASTMGNEQAEHLLYEMVDGNPQKFLEIWVDNKNRDLVYIIESALSKNVLRKTKNVYRYGSDIIGYSLDDVISYLDDPKNQDLKMAIMSEISVKDEFLGKEKETEKVEPEWGDDEEPVEEKSKSK
jgi:hypothetical protein